MFEKEIEEYERIRDEYQQEIADRMGEKQWMELPFDLEPKIRTFLIFTCRLKTSCSSSITVSLSPNFIAVDNPYSLTILLMFHPIALTMERSRYI